MSTLEEFESAPVGATATRRDGRCAIKTARATYPWDTPEVNRSTSRYMVSAGYTLDPLPPSTAREALDLAWNLAHPVKEGQVIPEGARYLEFQGSGLREYTTASDFKIRPGCGPIRTVEPLPEPEPDWLNAPAVLARVDSWVSCADPQVFARRDYHDAPSEWRCNGAESYPWQELRDVTPLYPREDNGGMYITGSGDIQFKDRNGQIVWEI